MVCPSAVLGGTSAIIGCGAGVTTADGKIVARPYVQDKPAGLHIHLEELGESVLIQIQNKVVHEVEAVANDYEGNLIGKFGLLQEVLDLLGIIVIGLPANLTCPCSSLDVLEVNLRVIAQVNDRTKVVIESLRMVSSTHMNIS